MRSSPTLPSQVRVPPTQPTLLTLALLPCPTCQDLETYLTSALLLSLSFRIPCSALSSLHCLEARLEITVVGRLVCVGAGCPLHICHITPMVCHLEAVSEGRAQAEMATITTMIRRAHHNHPTSPPLPKIGCLPNRLRHSNFCGRAAALSCSWLCGDCR